MGCCASMKINELQGAHINIYEDWWISRVHCLAKRERRHYDSIYMNLKMSKSKQNTN